MSVALADLVTRLQADIPARGGSPTATQYANALKDAVADYGRRVPMTLITTLSVVSGTATYSLPDDFLFIIKLDDFADYDGVIHTASGIVPLSSNWNERHTVNGRTITFTPTPTYSLERTLRYAALHVLEDAAYAYLTDEDVGILMLKAQALALRSQAFSLITSGSGEITEYAIGDERLKKTSPSERLSAFASGLEQAYLAAIATAVGTVGDRARYGRAGVLV